MSRFNRRLHRLAGWLRLLLEALSALFARGEAFLLDSLPVPVCRRARARRCREVRGQDSCGYCVAKRERFFGWRLHLVCTTSGVLVAFDLLPGGLPGAPWALMPGHELTCGLPAGVACYADKAYNAADDEAAIPAEAGVRLVPIRRATMRPNAWPTSWPCARIASASRPATASWRPWACSACARTTPGLERKVHASLLALTIANAD